MQKLYWLGTHPILGILVTYFQVGPTFPIFPYFFDLLLLSSYHVFFSYNSFVSIPYTCAREFDPGPVPYLRGD